jgi:hypothetical protein
MKLFLTILVNKTVLDYWENVFQLQNGLAYIGVKKNLQDWLLSALYDKTFFGVNILNIFCKLDSWIVIDKL